jgi:DNA mismatch repair protein MutS
VSETLSKAVEESVVGPSKSQASALYSPMLLQYLEFKGRYPDSLILFQVGDFYEVFFDDAAIFSKALNVTLTSRDKNSETPVMMAGVPVHAVETYLARLINEGFAVVIVSQALNSSGAIIRKLDRVITPGVTIQSEGSHPGVSPLVAARVGDGVAWSDTESGVIHYIEAVDEEWTLETLANKGVAELVVLKGLMHALPGVVPYDPRSRFNRELIRRLPEVKVRQRGESYLTPKPLSAHLRENGRRAVSLLLHYLGECGVESSINEIKLGGEEGECKIDSVSSKSLELVKNLKDGTEKGTLLGFLNRSVTAGGESTLAKWILSPLSSLIAINQRLDKVEALIKCDPTLLLELSNNLKVAPPLARIATRLLLDNVTPRELGSVRDILEVLPGIVKVLNYIGEKGLSLFAEKFGAFDALREILKEYLLPTLNLPSSIGAGEVINDTSFPELSRYRSHTQKAASWLSHFEESERDRTGINNLKVKSNNQLGAFIEITKSHLGKVPVHYQRRQTVTNYDRFTTPELKKLESELLHAKGFEMTLERKLWEDLKGKVVTYVESLRDLHTLIGELDALQSLAQVAVRESLVRPTIVEERILDIQDGAHPVLRARYQENFVGNDLLLNEKDSLALVVGPNMGGKSTYLRQSALITIMAHLGSFVPAKKTTIGLVDKVFARIGAYDDLHEGESTFMVEMREMGAILQGSTPSSLLIVDEIGRGTATLDGLAIARAIVEWLVKEVRCRTLFATHFHELISLANGFGGTLSIIPYKVGVSEEDGSLLFTKRVLPLHPDEVSEIRSYGIEIATLAGLPAALLHRADELLRATH